MGLMATTKHKDIDQATQERSQQHQAAVDEFNAALNKSGKSVTRMTNQCQAIGTAMNTAGLDSTAIQDIQPPRWQTILPIQHEDTDGSIKILLGIATGLTATAWGGRILSLGAASFTIGRIALGPIAILTMPMQILVGAKIAGRRERNADHQAEILSSYLANIETQFKAFPAPLEQCRESAKLIEVNLYTTTKRIKHTPKSIDTEDIEQIRSLTQEAQQTADDFSHLSDAIQEQFRTDLGQTPCPD